MTPGSDLAARDAEILRLYSEGKSRAAIREITGENRNVVDNAIGAAKRAGALAPARPQGALSPYEAMINAIAAARAVDEAKDIADRAEAMRIYARQAKNKEAEIDAAEIRIRAERRLGELIVAAKDVGQVAEGRPSRGAGPDENCARKEQFSRVTLAEAGIDRKLSARAQQLARLPEDDFAGQLSDWREKAHEEGERVTVRLIKGDVQQSKAQRRAVREEILGRSIAKLPAEKFGAILADPEWRFDPWSRRTGMDRAADNHYPTSATEVIASRPVGAIAADHAVLFLWATVPMLPHALLVMEAWGFDYRSHFVWAKDRISTGYWNRNRHELLLLGVKGDVPAPAMGTQWESLIEAAVGRHSEKPEAFLELIEHYFPTLPKIELNRRGPARPGWKAWGNEVEEIAELRGGTDEGTQNEQPTSPVGGLSHEVGEGRTAAPAEDMESESLGDAVGLASGRRQPGRDSRERPAPESRSESEPGQNPEPVDIESDAGTGFASRPADGRTSDGAPETGGEGSTLANPAPAPAPLQKDAGLIPTFLLRDQANPLAGASP